MTTGHVFVREPVNQVPDLQYKTDFISLEYRLQLPVLPLHHSFASMASGQVIHTEYVRSTQPFFGHSPFSSHFNTVFYYIILTKSYKTL